MTNEALAELLGGVVFSSEECVTLEVFVASRTKDGDECMSFGSWVRNIEREVVRVAGGCTRFDGTGSWINPETRALIQEHTAVIRARVGRQALADHFPPLRQVLVQYGRECEQHTVAFALDGEFFGLDPAWGY